MTSPPIIHAAIPPGPVRDRVWSPEAKQAAAELGLNLRWPDPTPLCGSRDASQGWKDFLADAQAVLTSWSSPRLDPALLDSMPGLKIVAHAAGSVTKVVSPEVFERGIRVSTANHLIARSVAEWGVMMTLFSVRKLDRYAKLGRAGGVMQWAARDALNSFDRLTVGVWGLGDAGSRLIELLAPLGPRRILVCDPRSPREPPAIAERVGIETLFKEADVVHLLASVNRSTRGRIDRVLIGSMKRGATLINAGRAELVDKQAMLDAASQDRINLILDVYDEEPPDESDPIHHLAGLVATPHCAGRSYHHLLMREMLEEIERYLRGDPLRHEVTANRAASMTQ